MDRCKKGWASVHKYVQGALWLDVFSRVLTFIRSVPLSHDPQIHVLLFFVGLAAPLWFSLDSFSRTDSCGITVFHNYLSLWFSVILFLHLVANRPHSSHPSCKSLLWCQRRKEWAELQARGGHWNNSHHRQPRRKMAGQNCPGVM